MDHCPHGYSDPQAWCDWRNAELAAQPHYRGQFWMVGQGGVPFLTEDEGWSHRQREKEAAAREEERKRFNWRQQHPVTEERAA